MRAGSSYIVGENGPEIFRAKRDGYIDPNMGGGPITIQQHFNGQVNPKAVEAATLSAIERIIGFRKKIRLA